MDVLDLVARSTGPMGISEIAAAMRLNKSTVYNMLHSLVDLAVLNKIGDKFSFGPKFYLLGRTIDYENLLSGRIRPHLEKYSEQTRLTASLGIRSGSNLIVLDRTVVPGGIDVVNKSRIRPLLDGVHGTAVLALLSDGEVEAFLERNPLTRYTEKTITDRKKYLRKISGIRESGVALDREEYHPGIWAAAVAFPVPTLGVQAVIWTFGLESRVDDCDIQAYAGKLRDVVRRIGNEFK